MIYDGRATLYDGMEGVLLLLVYYWRTSIRCWPSHFDRKDIIGVTAYLDLIDKATEFEGRYYLPDGTELVLAANYAALLVDADLGTHERVQVQLSGTQWIKAKRLNTILSSLMVPINGVPRQAPLFYRAYQFKTKPENHDSFGWDIMPGPCILENSLGLPVLPNGENLYEAAREFSKELREAPAAGN